MNIICLMHTKRNLCCFANEVDRCERCRMERRRKIWGMHSSVNTKLFSFKAIFIIMQRKKCARISMSRLESSQAQVLSLECHGIPSQVIKYLCKASLSWLENFLNYETISASIATPLKLNYIEIAHTVQTHSRLGNLFNCFMVLFKLNKYLYD